MRAGVCSIEPWQFHTTIWSWAPPHQLLINFTRISRGTKIERGVASSRSKFPFAFAFFLFSTRKSRIPFPFLDLYLSYRTTIAHLPLPFAAVHSTPPSRFVEHRRMDSQQLTHNAHGAVSSDVFQPPFYPSFPEVLDSSKVTQAPHSSPSYVHQQYAPDSGASLEGGRSPPLPFDIHEQPSQQGHRHFDPSPRPQQYQPSPSVAHPVFPHDHEGPYPTHQGLSHQLSRTPAHSAPMPISPWEVNAFSENSSAQSTALRGGISPISPIYGATYVLRPQPVYHPPPTYRSAPIHAPPELSQPTTTPGPSTLREQQDGAVTDQGKRSRSWGGVGSLDPATGVFSPASDHPRMRTAQACEKCRARKAKVSIIPPSPRFPLIPPRSFSDQRPALLSLSAPATIRHASGVWSAGWNANTLPSAACAGPTSQSPHSPQCRIDLRSPPSWRDRKPANALPPCLPFNAGDCRFGVRVSSNRNRSKVSNS